MMQTALLKCHCFLAPDIDECRIANQCHQNATCNNTKGSYNCTCKGGFKGDGRINCTGTEDFVWRAYLTIKIKLERFFLQKWRFQQRLSEFVRQHNNFQFHLFVIVCFTVIPSKAISVPWPHIDKLQIKVPFINWNINFFARRCFSAELRLQWKWKV